MDIPWSNSILRHTFATYHLAKHRNATETAHIMGHTDLQMLRAHYAGLVQDQDDIELFWSVKVTSA